MSKFWAGSDSSSSDDEYSESGSFEEEKQFIPSKYAMGDSDSDFEDDEVRIVRSAKQKRAILMNSIVEALKDGLDDNDFLAVSSNFDKLTKEVEKAMKSDQTREYPDPYLAVIVALTKFFANIDKSVKKSLSKTGTKAFNGLQQKLKKLNKEHERVLKKYTARADPDEEEWGVWEGAEDEFESDDGFTDSDDDESDDDEFETSKADKGSRKNKWMMKDDDDDDDTSKKNKKKERRMKRTVAAADDDDEDTQDKATTTVDAMAGPWDEARVEKSVRELLSKRGLRGTDANRQISQWRRLLKKASRVKSARSELLVLVHTVTAEFDSNSALATPLKRSLWRDATTHCLRIVDLLSENSSLTLHGDSDTAGDEMALAAATQTRRKRHALLGATLMNDSDQSSESEDDGSVDEGDDESAAQKQQEAAAAAAAAAADNSEDSTDETAPLVIGGSLASFLERLDVEWRKSLQVADASSQVYVTRLRDEGVLLLLAQRIGEYYKVHKSPKLAARVAVRIIDHLYYRRYDPVLAAKLKQLMGDEDPNHTLWLSQSDHADLLAQLTQQVYAHGDERSQTRALLAGVYHDAVHDRYTAARDALLMSHTQETIHHADIATQVLFNRAMAQIGLCAFRRGAIADAHAALAELYANSRVKELLAQGTSNSRYGERSPEAEKAEKRRQIPYHMHINLELLESVHLTSALLLEVPVMVSITGNDNKRRVISRVFRRLLDYADRQVFAGPPESTRDSIVAAARALMRGNWSKCSEILTGLSCWQLMPQPDATRAVLRRLVQREGLRAYLLAYSGAYESLSLPTLAKQFELPRDEVHALCSRMMVRDELSAAWEQPTDSIALHRVEPSRLQQLALQFADRAATFVENNERLFDARTGGYGFKEREESKNDRERSSRSRHRTSRAGYAGRRNQKNRSK